MADQMEQDPGLRDFWVTGPIKALRRIEESPQQIGVQLFSWVDDNFLVPGKAIECLPSRRQPHSYVDNIYKLPGRGAVGDYVWGIVDGWRRPRPEYWLTKKLFSPIRVQQQPLEISRRRPSSSACRSPTATSSAISAATAVIGVSAGPPANCRPGWPRKAPVILVLTLDAGSRPARYWRSNSSGATAASWTPAGSSSPRTQSRNGNGWAHPRASCRIH